MWLKGDSVPPQAERGKALARGALTLWGDHCAPRAASSVLSRAGGRGAGAGARAVVVAVVVVVVVVVVVRGWARTCDVKSRDQLSLSV